MTRHANGRLFSRLNVFADDFCDNYFYLSEIIEEIVRVDSIRTRERYELFRLLLSNRRGAAVPSVAQTK